MNSLGGSSRAKVRGHRERCGCSAFRCSADLRLFYWSCVCSDVREVDRPREELEGLGAGRQNPLHHV